MYTQFFSKNYVDRDSSVQVSSNDILKTRAYDRVKNTRWESIGETDEDGNYSTYIECDFMAGGYSPVKVARTFDTLFLINCNLKEFKLQYWTGSNWQDITETITTDNTGTTVMLKFVSNPVTSDKVRLVMDKTITPNEEKQVGEFMVMLYKVTMSDTLADHNRRDIEIGGKYRLADGTLEKFIVATKTGVRKTYRNIRQIQRDKLVKLKEENKDEPVCLYPDGDKWKDDIWEGDWMNAYSENYDYKTNYYSITIEFEEK